MVIDFRIRKCLNIQYDKMQLKDMVASSLEDNDRLFCIYKGNMFFANMDYQELRLLTSNEELYDYIDNNAIQEWVYGFDIARLSNLFHSYKDASAIIVEMPDANKSEILTVNRADIGLNSNYIDFSVYMKLKQEGVMVYIVNLPQKVQNVYGSFCTTGLTEQWLRDPAIKKMFENDLKRITDFSDIEYTAKVLDRCLSVNQEETLGFREEEKENRKIFLVGPCIVMGCSPSEESLADRLTLLLEKNNLTYKIIKINSRYFPNKLLEYDICKNDIVIFMGASLAYKDFDLTEVYEEYKGTKNLCTNSTMHISEIGCELIAQSIMDDIIIMHENLITDNKDDTYVLHYSEKMQLPYEAEYEVKMYLKRTNIPRWMRRGWNNGAIVMNANPFTLGHRYLVEYASSKVDRLFIFVVEEDASFFTYEERLEMVQQGTKDIKNVIVLGSGNFIISNLTFYDYFTKESDNDKNIDASQDIYIFARYIAPYFGIKKRFVGNEPTDKVTDQYNMQMKKILPNYGCELIEIPRYKKDDNIVSGSMIRKALQNNNKHYLENMLPSSSFQYIYKNLNILRKRDNCIHSIEQVHLCMTDRMLRLWNIIEFIREEENIAIYGIGKDTQMFLKLLNKEEKEKLYFVDKRAVSSKLMFMEKEVMAPCELNGKLLKCNIIILPSRYYKEIYFECIDLGIDRRRINYNPFNLYSTLQV